MWGLKCLLVARLKRVSNVAACWSCSAVQLLLLLIVGDVERVEGIV